jgi:hypothetical protein
VGHGGTDESRVGTAETRNVSTLAGYKRFDTREKEIQTCLKKFEVDNLVEEMICYVQKQMEESCSYSAAWSPLAAWNCEPVG